jgi:hypothetical protein
MDIMRDTRSDDGRHAVRDRVDLDAGAAWPEV